MALKIVSGASGCCLRVFRAFGCEKQFEPLNVGAQARREKGSSGEVEVEVERLMQFEEEKEQW